MPTSISGAKIGQELISGTGTDLKSRGNEMESANLSRLILERNSVSVGKYNRRLLYRSVNLVRTYSRYNTYSKVTKHNEKFQIKTNESKQRIFDGSDNSCQIYIRISDDIDKGCQIRLCKDSLYLD